MRRFLVLVLTVLFCGLASADVSIHENYFPNVELTNQDGETLKFYDDVIKGKVVALSFIYARCKDVCPTDTAQMLQIRDILGDRVGKDIFFYSISVDPENDTPAVLKAYMNMFGVPAGWQFLTGKRDDIVLIQKKLGLIGAQAFVVRDHNISIMLGNESSGQWIKRSPYENPQMLANLLAGHLNAKGMLMSEVGPKQSYAKAVSVPNGGDGEQLYRTRCASCHTIGGGDGLGPDLMMATGKHTDAWMKRWLREPDKMIAEGDAYATAQMKQFRNLAMPNLKLDNHAIDLLIISISHLNRPSSEMDAFEQLLECYLICRRLGRLGLRIAGLGRIRIREHAEGGIHDDLGDARQQGMQHLAERTQPGGDAHRLVHDRLADHVGRLLRRKRRHIVVDGRDSDRP